MCQVIVDANMPAEIAIYSHLIVALTMLIFAIIVAFKNIKRRQRIPLLLVCISTFFWSLAIVLDNFEQSTSLVLMMESIRYGSWVLLLLSVAPANRKTISNFAPLLTTILILLVSIAYPALHQEKDLNAIAPPVLGQLRLFAFVGINILALGIIEQITRNSSEQERWKLKYILVAAGAIFTYDFCMFSDALMFQKTSDEFWLARGVINALIPPILFLGIRRLGSRDLSIHISRNVIFHSATVITAASYLLLMAAAGYYVRYINESLGSLFLLIFIFGGIVILATLLLSVKLRQTLRVILNKHFFGLKHDYRKQWLDFTHNLANSEGQVPLRVCKSVAQLIQASGALLWTKQENNQLSLIAHWHIPEPSITESEQTESLQPLVEFIEETHWVIDLEEFRQTPSIYGDLKIPDWMLSTPKSWLIIPFLYQDSVLGLIMLKRSGLSQEINWEDRDLLKLAGKQAAIQLAQYQSENDLIEARQFEAYHRLSTYVMHDLKNILAQQSLLVSNAEKHKSNPEFVDDMLRTIENSVNRMTRLLRQMKSGERNEVVKPTSITRALELAVSNRSNALPAPTFNLNTQEAQETQLNGDKEQLVTIFEHIIQNAQEATSDTGLVAVSINATENNTVIKISDSGAGMSQEFIRQRLFKPFDTTKGLAGMGIGVFESRQYIIALGGKLEVISKEDSGSEFTITLPSYIVSNRERAPEPPANEAAVDIARN